MFNVVGHNAYIQKKKGMVMLVAKMMVIVSCSYVGGRKAVGIGDRVTMVMLPTSAWRIIRLATLMDWRQWWIGENDGLATKVTPGV